MEYHKINTIYKRDDSGKLLEGEWSMPEFDYLQNNEWVWTEKIDGTNIRVMWNGENITFGGKTDRAQIPDHLFHKLNELFVNEYMNLAFKDTPDVCLYGEGYGVKIQAGGGNYLPNDVNFILFDVRVGKWWLKREDIEKIAEQLNIDIVPIVGTGTILESVELVRKGFTSLIAKRLTVAEGLVLRPKMELFTRSGLRIITKIKNRDFN